MTRNNMNQCERKEKKVYILPIQNSNHFKYLNICFFLHMSIFVKVKRWNVFFFAFEDKIAYASSLVPTNRILKEQELMNTQLLHSASFLTGLPRLVFEVGRTVLNSNYADFSLKECGQFRFLKHVDSFRDNLFEVRMFTSFKVEMSSRDNCKFTHLMC